MMSLKRCHLAVLTAIVVATGCAHTKTAPIPVDAPRELAKLSLPDYTIEPPDVLQIDLLHAVPKMPYRIQTLDVIGIQVANALQDAPIAGAYPVGPDGTVPLGGQYGSIKVVGLTLVEAKAKIEKELARVLKGPTAEVVLVQSRGTQQIRGTHLVRPDGTVGLGVYGAVRVTGLTIAEAKAHLEAHLAANFDKPEVSVEIGGFNSKVYYVIYDGGGAGQQVARLPITGSETVLDAVGQLAGLPVVSDAKRIWISRPTQAACGCVTLPVDWCAITECGDARTNYQLLPGDRVFVKAYRATAADVALARILAPVERVLGVSLLGVSTVRAFENRNNGGFGNNFVP